MNKLGYRIKPLFGVAFLCVRLFGYTQQFINDGWWNVFGAGWLANQEEGADEVRQNKNETAHSIFKFLDNINDLQEGTYEWNKDKQEWICTSCKND